MKRSKVNYTKGIWGSWDGQDQGKSDSYDGDQYLSAKHDNNLQYIHQYNYIPARNESGATKIQLFSKRRLGKSHT